MWNDEAWLQHHSKECSTLLFPGAEVTNSNNTNSNQQREIVHCDNCHLVVEGSTYCCQECFDYDLCSACYPLCVLSHADGNHEFRVERLDCVKGVARKKCSVETRLVTK